MQDVLRDLPRLRAAPGYGAARNLSAKLEVFDCRSATVIRYRPVSFRTATVTERQRYGRITITLARSARI